jgi:polyisoprenyl-phosphate glycosyltransferase
VDKNLLSVVIPVYNEADPLPVTLDEIRNELSGIGIEHEIIVVDDGSGDTTWSILCTLAGKRPEIRAIRLSRNFGKESALAAGLSLARGDAVIVMDGDGQHPPGLIPAMVKKWREESIDIVEGVKITRGKEPILFSVRAKLFYWLMKQLTNMDLDNTSDFKLIDRKVVDAHNRLPESTRFFRGIISWLGFTKASVPFSVRERTSGRSRWTTMQLVRLALRASTSFSSLPLHLVTLMGVGTFLTSLIIGGQTLYRKFSGSAVSGFATVILLTLLIGSILMISLGIIGTYIARIFEEVKKRPMYVVEETLNTSPPRDMC